MELFDLHDKVAIVTGGNGGLGRGMAIGLASAGADIVIAARNQVKTAATARELRERYGVRVLELSVDVCEETIVRAMVEQTLHTFGRVDILVNNAGTNIRKPPEQLSAAEWHTILDPLHERPKVVDSLPGYTSGMAGCGPNLAPQVKLSRRLSGSTDGTIRPL
jgi:2-dehydro-3-deoxy-D-gluconate 5-dehydrogenase